MTPISDAPSYDFVCLCCGAINGERIPACSMNAYVKDPEPDFKTFALAVDTWIRSDSYKGSILVPEGYRLASEEREAIVEMTARYRSTHAGVLLFARPEIQDLPEHAINISVFMH